MTQPVGHAFVASEPNPMRIRLGAGPGGVTCATCRELKAVSGHTRTFYKCLLRGVSSGAATDHRKRWRACAAYVPRPRGERP